MASNSLLLVALLLAIASLSLAQAACNPSDRAALLQIQAGFPDPSEQQWNSSDLNCCIWSGVTCTSSGRVIKLNFPNAFRYYAEFPRAVCKLSELQNLTYISFQATGGIIPRCIGNLVKLKHLDLSNNVLGGKIPAEIGKLTELEYLEIGENNLDADIPIQLCKLNKLRHLGLSTYYGGGTDRRSSGGLPSCLGDDLTRLKILKLSYRVLAGSVPATLGNLVNLEELWLDGNEFSATTIPSSLGNLVNLRVLRLGSSVIPCKLRGGIPSSFKNLVRLQELVLEGMADLGGNLPDISGMKSLTKLSITSCNTTGSLPIVRGKLLSLTELELENNLLTSIPLQLADSMPSLTRLILRDNKISRLPESLNRLSELLTLDLRHNALSGNIPASLGTGSLKKLENLDLSFNSLSGKIPSSLGSLPSLHLLVLNNNALSGSIPASLGKLPLFGGRSLDLSNNALSGKIPKKLSSFDAESFQNNSGLCGSPLPPCSSKIALFIEEP